jgi:hypothetical protein
LRILLKPEVGKLQPFAFRAKAHGKLLKPFSRDFDRKGKVTPVTPFTQGTGAQMWTRGGPSDWGFVWERVRMQEAVPQRRKFLRGSAVSRLHD